MGGIIFKNSGDDTKGQEQFLSAIMLVLGGVNLGLTTYNTTLKQQGKLNVARKLQQIRLNNVVTNLTLVSYMLSRYYLTNEKRIKPAAVLAGIPLGTVDELSMALSDRILKYRATGGVFLAHQDGGNESLRIICKAWGKKRYLFLIMLDFLFSYGQSRILDMFEGLTKNPIGGASRVWDKVDLSKKAQIVNPWREFNSNNIDEGREEYHMTFPIVTRNRIFSSMYLETYDIVESVNNGMNMLTCTLFLRKYRSPYPLQLIRAKEIQKGKKVPDVTSWYRSEKVEESTVYTKLRSLRWMDSVLDIGLSLIVMMHRYYAMMEYSIYKSPAELWALTMATHLDKAKGLDSGFNVGLWTDKNGDVKIDSVLEHAMGMLL